MNIKTREEWFVRTLRMHILELAQEQGFEVEELEANYFSIQREGYPAIRVTISILEDESRNQGAVS